MIIKLFLIFLAPLLLYGQTTNNFESFFKAISQVESGNNTNSFNKREGAIGIVQIRYLYFLDSQAFGKTKYKHSDCYSEKISKIICFNYLLRYQSRHNWEFEKMAKIHNGGCNWKKKEEKDGQVRKNLSIYWHKVERELKMKAIKINKETLQAISFACHQAALIREDSWDDEKVKYKINLKTACEQACEYHGLSKEISQLIYLAMKGGWNEVLEWADEIKSTERKRNGCFDR